MNSVTIVSAFRMNKSITLNAPQNLPKRSRISRAIADAGDRTEPEHHLLVHVQHGNKQQERPQQLGAVVLASLAVRRERACIIVADHHDQAGAHDGQQGLQLRRHRASARQVVSEHRAERAPDVTRRGRSLTVTPVSGPESRPHRAGVGWPKSRQTPLSPPSTRRDRGHAQGAASAAGPQPGQPSAWQSG